MYTVLRIICCSAVVYHATLVRSHHTCVKTDLFCYYTKECQQLCQRNETTEINANNYELPSVEELNTSFVEMASGSGLNGLYRPRSALARALYEKQRNDRHLQEFDQNEWYRVDTKRLSPELKDKFVQLDPDEDTQEFLSASIDKSSWMWTQIWYLLAKAILRHFWSITDINGWLGRGSMFVLSESHAKMLIEHGGHSIEGCSLVDVGAGDGEVSMRFGNLFSVKYATEISASMRKALKSKGYNLLDADEWWRTRQFECVCMMNLLDRCNKPITMLKQARAAIAPGGVLLLALVLPYKPYVEVNPDHKPEERLPIEGVAFEEQVASFVSTMRDAGFELRSWSRAPYLCEGDFAQAYYWLDDSVYVFTPTAIEPHT